MGDLGKFIGAVLTGGLSLAVDAVAPNLASQIFGGGSSAGASAASFLTGGLSDALMGKPAGAGLGNLAPLMNFMNPGLVSGQGVGRGLKKGNAEGFAEAINYAIDPITEPGIREVAGWTHEGLEEVSPGLSKAAIPVGTLIGAAAYGPLGAMGGSMIGSKIAAGEDDLAALISNIAAAGSYGLGGYLRPVITGALGNVWGPIVTGAIQGGATGGIKSASDVAFNGGEWEDVAKSALTGAVTGGLGAGIGQIGSALKDYMNPTVIGDLSGQYSTPYQVYGGEAPSNFDMYTNGTLFQQSPFLPSIDSYIGAEGINMPGVVGDLSGQYPQSVLDTYLPQDDLYARLTGNGQNLIFEPEPSLLDTAREYVGKLGNVMLENMGSINQLSSILQNLGAVSNGMSAPTEEGSSDGSAAPIGDWMSLLEASGTGKGKSKGREAGFVEKLKYGGTAFMPKEDDIEGYGGTGLYYS